WWRESRDSGLVIRDSLEQKRKAQQKKQRAKSEKHGPRLLPSSSNHESRITNHESRTTNHEPRIPMDTVFIEGLEIEALIGIYDWERRIRQPLRFDLEMAFDNRVPAASDDIADTLDYKAVSKRLIEFVEQSDF